MITLDSVTPRSRTRGLTMLVSSLCAFALLLGLTPTPAAAQAPPAMPPAEIEGGDRIDLGEAEPDETLARELTVTNTSDKTIRFERAMGSCSCIKGTVSTDPIAPGESATVSLTMQAIIPDGVQKKELWLFAEGYKRPLPIHVEMKVVDPNPIMIEVQPQELNAGYIQPGEQVVHEVILKNNGNEPIQFARVSTDCTCVQGELIDDLTAAGETARLKVTIEGKDIGPINQTLTVWYIGARKPIKIPVKAEVTLPIKAEPFFINMAAPVNINGKNVIPTTGEITLKSVDGKPFRVVSAGGKPPVLASGDANNSATNHIVTWDFTNTPDEDIQPWWIIETDHPEARLIDIRVLHPKLIQEMVQNQGPWTLAPDRVIVSNLAPGESYERTIRLLKTKGQHIESVEAASPMLKVELIDERVVGNGIEATIRVTATSDARGLIRSMLTVKADNVEQNAHLFVRVGS